jgi:predicted metal-dependent phosphoesterase TrpH
LDFEKNTTDPLTYYRKELYNKESPLYIDFQSLFFGVDEAVEAVHQAGGRAFLAHSYCYTAEVYDHLDDITDRYPLDGLECFYPAFTPKQTEEITALCKRKHLLMSGGSDFHGAIRPKIALGVGAGELNVSKENTPWIQNTF